MTETELTEEQELEITNKLIKKLTDFLVDAGIDYSLETWDSAEGKDIVMIGSDDKGKEHNVKFAFRNNGYTSIDVEEIEKLEGQND